MIFSIFIWPNIKMGIMLKYPNDAKVTTKTAGSRNDIDQNLHYTESLSHIYLSSDLILHEVAHENHIFYLYVSSSLDYGICPYCGCHNSSVHSRYIRTIQDLSILGEPVVLYVEVRKFFCSNHSCHKKTFAEQPGDEVFRYRRRTCRCERTVARHGVSTSAKSASRLLEYLGIRISASTVLRDLHRMKPPEYEDVAEIGVDDWAWRKGVRYGSIIIDYGNGRPIDLLGGRDTDSFGKWMEEHKKVEVVSRDRSTDYSSAIASSGRPITEVADKFHLIKNITDRMAKLIAENYSDYRRAIREEEGRFSEEMKQAPQSHMEDSTPGNPDSRSVKFREVKELQEKGFRPATIAKRLGIARQTATKYCRMEVLPQRNSKLRNEYHKYDAYVEQESKKGKALCIIHREITLKGFSGSLSPFYGHYKYLSDRLKNQKPSPRNIKPQDNRSALLPIRDIMSIIDIALKRKDMNESQQKTFDLLVSLPWFKEMFGATERFCQVIKGKETTELIRWMRCYWKTGIASLKTFILGIMRDFKAVKNTIKLDITNGITEGYVNKLKTIKRNMYGKAGIELLKNKIVMEHILFN